MRSPIREAAGALKVLCALAVFALPAVASPETPVARPAPSTPPAAAAEIRIETADADGVLRAVAAAKGKVAILNFWATWCDPCREEFPDLVRFASENPGGVALIAVSLDDPSDAETRVRPFLKEMRFAGRALIKGAGDPDLFITRIDPKWSGSLPATFIHAPDGSRAQSIHGALSYDRLKATAAPLLPH